MPVVDKNEKWTGEPNAQSDPNQLPQAKNDGSTTTPFVTISEDNKAGGLGAFTIQTSALMANDQGGAAKNFYQVVQLWRVRRHRYDRRLSLLDGHGNQRRP